MKNVKGHPSLCNWLQHDSRFGGDPLPVKTVGELYLYSFQYGRIIPSCLLETYSFSRYYLQDGPLKGMDESLALWECRRREVEDDRFACRTWRRHAAQSDMLGLSQHALARKEGDGEDQHALARKEGDGEDCPSVAVKSFSLSSCPRKREIGGNSH